MDCRKPAGTAWSSSSWGPCRLSNLSNSSTTLAKNDTYHEATDDLQVLSEGIPTVS